MSGWPLCRTDAGRSVPGNVERDRLVTAINQRKPDKKTHVKVQAIPLNGMTRNEVAKKRNRRSASTWFTPR